MFVFYATAVASILAGNGTTDQQYSCTKSKNASEAAIVSTAYARSLIDCSFICKENSDCKTFKFSSGVCTTYWKPADQDVAETLNSLVTCYNERTIVCPTSKDGGKYSCAYSSTMNFCLCMSTAAMALPNGDKNCKNYGMKLVAVQDAAKNTFIKNFLENQTNTFQLATATAMDKGVWPCALTSGVRDVPGLNSFMWNTTQTKVDISINNSTSLDNTGDYLIYSSRTPVSKWGWDDYWGIAWCTALCEFVP